MSISDVITSIGTLVTIAAVVVGVLLYLITKKPGKPSTKVLIIISMITTVIVIGIVGTAVFISASTTIAINGQKTISIPGFLATTKSPTSIPSPTPTPKVIPEDRNIDCVNCVTGDSFAFTLTLNTIMIDYSNKQTRMKFTIINSGTSDCNLVNFQKLEFQDENGGIVKARDEGQPITDSLAPGNSYIATPTFDLLPKTNDHYNLNISLDCDNTGPFTYKNQDFVFP